MVCVFVFVWEKFDTIDGALCLPVLDLVRALLDVKNFACGDLYKQFTALEGVLRPVEARAKKEPPVRSPCACP